MCGVGKRMASGFQNDFFDSLIGGPMTFKQAGDCRDRSLTCWYSEERRDKKQVD